MLHRIRPGRVLPESNYLAWKYPGNTVFLIMRSVESTRAAFELLLETPYYWSLTGEPTEKRWYYRSALKTGKKPITLDKMQELLQKAGFTIKTDIVWNIPQGT
ncbi:hypothetical protein [Arsenicibacter rosenii]|uniref:Uncharacterized protein n=1 Tax=Arsenicibacter rosenii TaxID=1750698 RepID=A0A1S2VEE0_9BACT|nr:hypothetical protein [Arsenicibacter rosenii]OIN56780.1 hypothetical protein BLX24_22655 [Arsenicibacter rosenii]